MAAAFARRRNVPGVTVLMGGTRPAMHVHPEVVAVMREAGVDLKRKRPRTIPLREIGSSDVVVTMGCAAEDVCPAKFRGDVVDWACPHPAGKPIEEVRGIRDEIERRATARLNEASRGR